MPFDGSTEKSYIEIIRDRRERAAAILREIPPEKFDLGLWYEDSSCGTTACALGWLAHFQFEGMTLVEGIPRYKNNLGFCAGQILFGLHFHDAKRIFSHRDNQKRLSEVTPSDVADAILAAPITTESMSYDHAVA